LRVLLDTHVFLWLNTEPERLGEHLPLVEDVDTELLFSAASSWEIAIKYGLGRLSLPQPPDRYVPERIRVLAARAIAVEHTHALAVAGLPLLHRDPFDRVLVAQAQILGVPLLTADPAVAEYPIETLLA
jgi:PIN domain nuclease of toxin-antitoxin system